MKNRVWAAVKRCLFQFQQEDAAARYEFESQMTLVCGMF